jgi:glycosyltransferase involved in cell wall biosynthesis
MKTKISLITVCKNSASSVEKALQSVISQSYDQIEYIVIDGNSVDGTQEIIEKYREKIHYYISETDQNWADAMNKGVRAATGDYISFVNADDYLIDDNVVEEMAGVISKNQNYLVFYGDTEIRPDPAFSDKITIFKAPSPGKLIDSLILNVGPFMGSSYYSRQVFIEVGYLSTSFDNGNDTEWFLKFFECWDETKFYYHPRIIFSYSMCGHSSRDIEATVKAGFEFVDNSPILQTDYWLKIRIKKLQERIILFEVLYHRTQELSLARFNIIQRLEGDVQRLLGDIKRLESDIQRLLGDIQRLEDDIKRLEGTYTEC